MKRAVAISLGLGLAAGTAQAFSEPSRFGEPAVDGGAGGRYFTGGRGDGLGCSVCHRGGSAPEVEVRGWPDETTAGRTYDLTVRWDSGARATALMIELQDGAGVSPGLTLPVAQPAGARCTDPAGAPSAELLDLGARKVVAVLPCGATEVAVQVTGSSQLVLAIGAVASDGSETSEGDGVTEVRRELGGEAAGGCAVGGGHAGALVGLAVASLLRRRRRRQ